MNEGHQRDPDEGRKQKTDADIHDRFNHCGKTCKEPFRFRPIPRVDGAIIPAQFALNHRPARVNCLPVSTRATLDRLGTLLLKEDGPKHFALDFRPFRVLSTFPAATMHVTLDPLGTINSSLELNTPRKTLQISKALVDRFYSAQHGSGKSDLVLSARHVITQTRIGACSSQMSGPKISRHVRGLPSAICINDEIRCGDQHDVPPVCETPPVFEKCW